MASCGGVFGAALLLLAAATIVDATRGPDIHACPEEGNKAAFSWRIPKELQSRPVVITDPAGNEFLTWYPVNDGCTLAPTKEASPRVSFRCDINDDRVLFRLLRPTPQDVGKYSCRKEVLSGPLVDDCGQTLYLLDVDHLSRECTYSDASRAVLCENVTLEAGNNISVVDTRGTPVYSTQRSSLNWTFADHSSGHFKAIIQGPKACYVPFYFYVTDGALGTMGMVSLRLLATFVVLALLL